MAYELVPTPPPLAEQVLQSSQRLSASEIANATAFMSASKRCISVLDAAIVSRAVSGEGLNVLTQQRENIVQQVRQHTNTIRCIRRLPPEIVSRFLAACLLSTPPDVFHHTPWYLGHICQYWRDVALTTPILWCDVLIDYPDAYPVEKLQTLLARSSNAALKVGFWVSSRATELLRVLFGSAPRWASVIVFVDLADWASLAHLQGSLPALRCLRLQVCDTRDSTITGLTDPFEFAPALVDLALEGRGLQNALVLPFRLLHRLKMETSYDVIAAILRRTHNLKVANLYFNDRPPTTGPPSIRLPHLRRLYGSQQVFLNHLELSALEEICTVDTDPAPLLSLLERCPTIRLKTLRMERCNAAHLALMLDASPTVQTLGVRITHGDDVANLLRQLTVGRIGTTTTFPGIGPNVHSIFLAVDHTPLNYEHFVDMVQSRWRMPREGGPCTHLRSVELLILDWATMLSASVEQRLNVLREEGLQVSILHSSDAGKELINWHF
ncbi:hypothetical protein K438DRAFT_1710360 [Mycena galopus ATCC 62051]|nr:hypothetical protein K438DRAFT_1710360 [Mycena galopus ATCC 62051]